MSSGRNSPSSRGSPVDLVERRRALSSSLRSAVSSVEIDSPIDRLGSTPLHRSAAGGRLSEVEDLLDSGSNPDVADSDGFTPMFLAAYKDQSSVLVALLKAGANADHCNRAGATAIMYAARSGAMPSALVLVDAGADLNRANRTGRTALIYAAQGGHLSVVRLLVEHGAQVDAVTVRGQSALDAALAAGHSEVAELLRRAGAKPGPGPRHAIERRRMSLGHLSRSSSAGFLARDASDDRQADDDDAEAHEKNIAESRSRRKPLRVRSASVADIAAADARRALEVGGPGRQRPGAGEAGRQPDDDHERVRSALEAQVAEMEARFRKSAPVPVPVPAPPAPVPVPPVPEKPQEPDPHELGGLRIPVPDQPFDPNQVGDWDDEEPEGNEGQ